MGEVRIRNVLLFIESNVKDFFLIRLVLCYETLVNFCWLFIFTSIITFVADTSSHSSSHNETAIEILYSWKFVIMKLLVKFYFIIFLLINCVCEGLSQIWVLIFIRIATHRLSTLFSPTNMQTFKLIFIITYFNLSFI